MNFEDFCKYIKSLDENTSIGIHGIMKEKKDDNYNLSLSEIGNKITNEGLEIHGWGGILNTVKMFGRVKDLGKQDLEGLYNYVWQVGNNGEIINILFGFPETITNSLGEMFYLGHFNKNNTTEFAKGKKEAGSDLPLNNLFDNLHRIPKEFIIGCMKSQQNNPTIQLLSNKEYYEFNNNQLFYDNLFKTLEEEQIINIVDYYNNRDLLSKFGIDVGIILQQYEEYLSNNKTK